MPKFKRNLGAEVEDWDLDEIKRGVDLREVIQLDFERDHGAYKSGRCPFHPDENPSFLVYPDRYTCLSSSCGAWGDVYDYLSYVHPASPFEEIVRMVQERSISGSMLAGAPFVSYAPPELEPLPDPMDYSVGYLTALTESRMRRFSQKYWITNTTIRKEKIGYDSIRKAFVIPVYDDHENVVTLRFRRDDYHRTSPPKYWGLKDRNQVLLYNRRALHRGIGPILFFFGELKALLAYDLGLRGVSQTNGCRAFQKYLLPLFDGEEKIIVIPDVGEEDAGVATAKMFGERGYLLNVPLDKPGADFNDLFTMHGWTLDTAVDWIACAKPWGDVDAFYSGVVNSSAWSR